MAAGGRPGGRRREGGRGLEVRGEPEGSRFTSSRPYHGNWDGKKPLRLRHRSPAPLRRPDLLTSSFPLRSNSLRTAANQRPEGGDEDGSTDQSPSAPAHGGGELVEKERGRTLRSANEDAAWLRGMRGLRVARLPIGGGAGEVRACAKRRRKRKQRGGAKMAYQTFRQEYLQVPPVTRAYTTACVLTTAAVVRWEAGPGPRGVPSARWSRPLSSLTGGSGRAAPQGLGGLGGTEPANGSGRPSRDEALC